MEHRDKRDLLIDKIRSLFGWKRVNIYCAKCEEKMEYDCVTDDLQGNLREYYKCPKCGFEIYLIIATVEDE